LTCSIRKGGSVCKGEQIYLGRVLDKEKHIFKSRERGVFFYDLESGNFSGVPAGYEEPKQVRKTKNPKRPTRIISFGDIFLLDSYIRKTGMSYAIDATKYRNPDTLYALLAYYILSPHANCHAQDWWELTYARISIRRHSFPLRG
jgi:hypothetical protein